MSKYLITTFGCQANTADSEKTAEIMEKLGYISANSTEDLISAKNPVLIFNTCSVRQKAEDRIFGLNNKIQSLKTNNCFNRLYDALFGKRAEKAPAAF